MQRFFSQDKYFRYATTLWIYTIAVILWGAYVRISRSGDGCGQSWPLCHGEVLPQNTSFSANISTWIEWTHRLSTGVFGLAVIVLVVMAFKIFPVGHRVRKASLWTLFFTLTEALIGAKLVLSGLVGDVSSFQRALVMSIHQINSLFLTGSLAMSFRKPSAFKQNLQKDIINTKIKSYILQIGFLLLAITGAIAALSSTLFPSESLVEGLRLDLQEDAHWLIKWRISHPIFATFYISISLFFISSFRTKNSVKTWSWQNDINYLMLLYLLNFMVGLANLLTLSPISLKLIHLSLTHLLWSYLLYFLHLSGYKFQVP